MLMHPRLFWFDHGTGFFQDTSCERAREGEESGGLGHKHNTQANDLINVVQVAVQLEGHETRFSRWLMAELSLPHLVAMRSFLEAVMMR